MLELRPHEESEAGTARLRAQASRALALQHPHVVATLGHEEIVHTARGGDAPQRHFQVKLFQVRALPCIVL